ncbi:MAG: hypothetical protein U0L65_04760 [Bacteroidales bacterium]|nr:hypothetical protein [Bacteroidales bacterium]
MAYDIRLLSIENRDKIEQFPKDYTRDFVKNYLEELTLSQHLFVKKNGPYVYYTYLRRLNSVSNNYFGFCFVFTNEYIEDIKEFFNICEDLVRLTVNQNELLTGSLPMKLVRTNPFKEKEPELKRIENWFKEIIEEKKDLIKPFKGANNDTSKINIHIDIKPDEEMLFAIQNYNNINYHTNEMARSAFGSGSIIENKENISGWLAFFLWVGVLGGACISVVLQLLNLEYGFSWIFWVVDIIMISCLIITAIKTVRAFLKRESNAVSWATTYIAMIVLDGIMSLIIGGATNDSSMYPSAIRQFLWGGIWFAYLINSNKVRNVIPKSTRTWKWFEKIILIIYILILSTFTISVVSTAKSENPQNIFITNNTFIDESIKESNKDLPMDIGEGIILQEIKKMNNSIIYVYQINNVRKSETDADYLKENAMVSKHEILYSWSKDINSDPFADACFKEEYNIIFKYNDANSKFLYSITITPDEYNQIVENKSYKCPINVIQNLVNEYNATLPIEYMGDASLTRIYLSQKNSQLVYNVTLPVVSQEEIDAMNSLYLKNYILENWPDLSDSMNRLAIVNQMNIVFDFFTHSGKHHCAIKITPDDYNDLK